MIPLIVIWAVRPALFAALLVMLSGCVTTASYAINPLNAPGTKLFVVAPAAIGAGL